MKIVAAMLSYKMPELTDKTVEQIIKGGFRHAEDLFIFENQASDRYARGEEKVSRYVTHFTGSNLRMTGGFNHICDTVSKWPEDEQPDVLWLCTNDFDVLETRVLYDARPIPELIEQAFSWPGARGSERFLGWWHPALEPIPGYAYPWMFNQEKGQRDTWMTDFICPAIKWQALKVIRETKGYWFEPRFYRGWGIDYETCYFLRQMGYAVRVDDNMVIRHEASKTYDAGAAPESRDEFYNRALGEMRNVMRQKYGHDWVPTMQEGR